MAKRPTGHMLAKWSYLVWSERGPKSVGTKGVLEALIRHGGKTKILLCPSEERLGKMTGLNRDSVRRHLKIAEAGGWIEARRVKRKDQTWANKIYKVKWPHGFDPKQDPWMKEKEKDIDMYRDENDIEESDYVET